MRPSLCDSCKVAPATRPVIVVMNKAVAHAMNCEPCCRSLVAQLSALAPVTEVRSAGQA